MTSHGLWWSGSLSGEPRPGTHGPLAEARPIGARQRVGKGVYCVALRARPAGSICPHEVVFRAAFLRLQGASRCQTPAMMQPIGSIVSMISARENSAIWPRTVAAFL